jgi:hypothetical protein
MKVPSYTVQWNRQNAILFHETTGILLIFGLPRAVFWIRIRLYPNSMTAWIRIFILIADQGDLKMAKKEGNNASKMQIIRHKRYKKQFIGIGNWYKMGNRSVTFQLSF